MIRPLDSVIPITYDEIDRESMTKDMREQADAMSAHLAKERDRVMLLLERRRRESPNE